MQTDFLIEDQGDGWWQCPSPLECAIIDGPTEMVGADGEFWLVSTNHAIESRPPPALLVERFGADHPLNKPFGPTSLVVVMAIFGDDGWSVPAYPVDGDAQSVSEAEPMLRTAAKVHVVFPS